MADRVGELDADLVVLGGDFVSHARSDMDGLERVLTRFRGRDGVVAVLGNHDHWVDPDQVGAAVERSGATLLHNRHRLIRRGAAVLAVGGVDDFTHGAVRPDEAFAGVAPDVPRVLLAQSRSHRIPARGAASGRDACGTHAQRPGAPAAPWADHGAVAVRPEVPAWAQAGGAVLAVRLGGRGQCETYSQ